MAKRKTTGGGGSGKSPDAPTAPAKDKSISKSSTALATIGDQQYAILAVKDEEVRDIIRQNVGPRGFDLFSLDRLRIPAGAGLTWTLPGLEGDKPVEELVGIVVYWQDVRVFWELEYSGANDPPNCSSDDCRTGVGSPGGDCAKCPHSQWGSGKDGVGQRCKECRRLFMITPDDLFPILIGLPPTSLGPAKKYFIRLASKQRPYWSVVTRIGLTKDKNRGGIEYAKAEFRPAEMLDAKQAEAFRALNAIFEPQLKTAPVDASDYSVEFPSADDAEPDADKAPSPSADGATAPR